MNSRIWEGYYYFGVCWLMTNVTFSDFAFGVTVLLAQIKRSAYSAGDRNWSMYLQTKS